MPIFSRVLLWPPGFLPRRSTAATTAAQGPIPVLPAAAAAVDSSAIAPDGPTEPAAAPSEPLGERRAQALRGMFPMLFSMYARRSDLWQAIAVERYLSQAANVADLEHRIREVERRRQFQWSE